MIIDSMPDLLDPDTAATYLGVSRQYIYKLIHKGELQAISIARHFRIPKKALIQYIKEEMQNE
jgi:excisionase family DNA binding protein